MFGSSSVFRARKLMDRDVVLVTINYRLGPLGKYCTVKVSKFYIYSVCMLFLWLGKYCTVKVSIFFIYSVCMLFLWLGKYCTVMASKFYIYSVCMLFLYEPHYERGVRA
jgi:hypothetical protein